MATGGSGTAGDDGSSAFVDGSPTNGRYLLASITDSTGPWSNSDFEFTSRIRFDRYPTAAEEDIFWTFEADGFVSGRYSRLNIQIEGTGSAHPQYLQIDGDDFNSGIVDVPTMVVDTLVQREVEHRVWGQDLA